MQIIVKLLVLIVPCVLATGTLRRPITRTVQTSSGGIRGIFQSSQLVDAEFFAFKGIPYAKPPIGDLRFKAPEPIDPWHPNVINAYNYRNACMQPYTNEVDTGTSEDCLYLNIYVPVTVNPAADEKLPVLFHIHGGAFFKNSADDVMNGPDFLVQHGIILVTMNFRQNIFGHLTLNTPEISGNQDFKDQQLALEWVYENIAHFGGDHTRITLMGHSSGGISANYLAIHPTSSSRVAGVFAMGASLGGMASWNHADHLDDMLERTNTTNIDDLLAFLMAQPAEVILDIAYPIEYHTPFGMYWGPVIEREDAVRAFITKPPREMYAEKCVSAPTLFLFAETEAFPVLPSWQMVANITAIGEFIDNFEMPLPLRYYDDLTEDDRQAFSGIMGEMKEFYFGAASTDDEKVLQLIHLYSDIAFTATFLMGFKLHRQHACHDNTYLFQTGLDGAFNFMKEPSQFNMTDYPYTGHVDPLNYLFPLKTHLHVYEEVLNTRKTDALSRNSWNAMEIMSKMCADFVKLGKPFPDDGPQFPAMQENLAPYMKLTRTAELAVQSQPFRGVSEFYEDLLARSSTILDQIRANKLRPPHHSEL